MNPVRIAVIFFLTCFASSGQQPVKNTASVEALPVCTLIADAAKFDGMEVVVKGNYRMVIHGAVLIGPSCSKTDVNLRQSPRYRASKPASDSLRSLTKKDRFRPVEVVLRGTFRVAPEGQCFGQIFAAYEIETDELLAAGPVQP